MITKEEAIQKVKEQKTAAESDRRNFANFCLLQMAYDVGNQWSYPSMDNGQYVVKQLRQRIDPSRDDVRATMNLIHSQVQRFVSVLAPERLSSYCRAATGSMDNRIVADLSDQVLTSWLARTNGLRTLREANRPRAVLGTGVVKRTLARRPGAAAIKTYDLGWCSVLPWELIRDPAATTTNPARDENLIIHEKPRTVDWVARNFGVKVEAKSTLGQLVGYQEQIGQASGASPNRCDSKAPAVMMYEAYYKDSEEGMQDWAWMLMAYCDPTANRDEYKVLSFGPNPFFGLPFHFFIYDEFVQSKWGVGIPHLQYSAQNLYNAAWTWIVRVQAAGAGKWIYENGTVEPAMLNNRIDVPIVWKRPQNMQAVPPSRTPAPQLSPASTEIVNAMPGLMDRQINLSPVQRGITSARGESGEAIQAKLSEANAPIDHVKASDNNVIQELLYGTLIDLTNPATFNLNVARELLGDDVPQDQIMMLLTSSVPKSVTAVVLQPGMTYPATPSEKKADAFAMMQAQMLTRDEALWILDEKGVPVDPLRSESRRTQEMEIARMIRGEDVRPGKVDEHPFHIWTIKRYAANSHYADLDPEVKGRIELHLFAHEQMMQAQQNPAAPMGGTSPDQAPAPSPSSEASAAAASSGAGTVGSATQAA